MKKERQSSERDRWGGINDSLPTAFKMFKQEKKSEKKLNAELNWMEKMYEFKAM